MKKVLFGLFAVLSISAMGASSQQLVDSALSATTTGDQVGAGVPFEVRVNVVPKGPELCITDENGNLYDNMVFDHGTKLAGTLSRSVQERTAILTRTDGYPFSATIDGKTGSTKYTGKFEVLPNNNYDSATNILTLEKLSSAGDTASSTMTMDTEFNFIKQNREVSSTDNQLRTLVQSVIPAGTKADGGMYIGTGTFTATLTVK